MPILTPDEKARIEAEERKRHEEEQYRTEVRANLTRQAVHPSPAAIPPPKPAVLPFSRMIAGTTLIIIALVALCGIAVRMANTKPRLPDNDTNNTPAAFSAPRSTQRYAPVTTAIASGQVIVRHGSAVYYRFTITPEMRAPVVTGNFSASGGSGNDIAAVITDENEYVNWINGHQAQVYWCTQGRETAGRFEVRLKPGTYYLAFSNRFSAFHDKDVFVNASLDYQLTQTN